VYKPVQQCTHCGAGLSLDDLRKPNCTYCGTVLPHHAQAAQHAQVVGQVMGQMMQQQGQLLDQYRGAFGVPPVGVGGSGQTSTGSGDPPIACGMEECDPASEVCCATFNGAACIPADQDCQGATITCTSVAQCDDGEICCGTFGGGNGQTSCTSEPCGGGGPGSGVQLCESDAECPPDVPCEPAPGGIGFNFCNPGFG